AQISAAAVESLKSYHWPGNIRELENVVQRAVILCDDDGVIDCRQLPVWLQGEEQSSCGTAELTLAEALADLEKRLIGEALEHTKGNMSKAAEKLGTTERIMGLRMKEYGLDYHAFRRKG
ncbi:AAA family ATPase, partial [Deltaproteobacteria bacterium OttesenSCG-928-M10]|nr:AAA family ATPase [Deltaproteobacteria bacterium OttesenSCG-928-M10]